jgi:hypothetical protein
MSERLPYEEQLPQQWNNLPLPDEDMAWADMKHRLEEEEDKPLLPFWLRGCAGWALLGLLVVGLGWWMLRPDKWGQKKKENAELHTAVKEQTSRSDSAFTLKDTSATATNKNQQGSIDSNRLGTDNNSIVTDSPSEEGIITVPAAEIKRKNQNQFEVTGNQSVRKNKKSKPAQLEQTKYRVNTTGKDNVAASKGEPDRVKVKKDTAITAQQKIVDNDTAISIARNNVTPDSVQKKKIDTTTKKTPPARGAEKKEKVDSSVNKKLSFSAGIGLQQQLPLAGQKLTPYNRLGRKGSLADYIPSVYVRMEKEKKWFLQAEFRYGAPQHTKEFIFRQAIVNSDTTLQPQFTTTTSNTLKKTFYHQLPLAFNYYVLPGWSVGTGIQWNKFSSAVTENESIQRNNFAQQDTSLGKTITPLKKDSAYEFSKSYLQAIVETQYQWKRFSFGARYTFGLQPYIRFTLPGGTLQEEKNSALQVFLRYRLWKSGK